MEHVKRYNFYWTKNVGSIQNEADGQYVLFSDYEELQKQNNILRSTNKLLDDMVNEQKLVTTNHIN